MIRLDFARTVPRSLQVLRSGMLAAGAAAAASVLLWSDALQGRLDALDWKRQAAAPIAASSTPRRSDGKATGSPQLREVLHELSVDWRALFATIEGAMTPGVRIMSIRPDLQRQTLQIQAKAASGAQAQRFVERLQAGGTITDAHLVHEARDEDEEQIDFSVRAHWEVKP